MSSSLSKKQERVLRVALGKLVLAAARPESIDNMVDDQGTVWTTVNARSNTFSSLADRGLMRVRWDGSTGHRAWVTLTDGGWRCVFAQRWATPIEDGVMV